MQYIGCSELEGNRDWLLMSDSFFRGDENILKLNVVMVAQLCKETNNPWILYYVDYLNKAFIKRKINECNNTPYHSIFYTIFTSLVVQLLTKQNQIQ